MSRSLGEKRGRLLFQKAHFVTAAIPARSRLSFGYPPTTQVDETAKYVSFGSKFDI